MAFIATRLHDEPRSVIVKGIAFFDKGLLPDAKSAQAAPITAANRDCRMFLDWENPPGESSPRVQTGWLEADFAVPLPLERSYEATSVELRVPL
jgi:hypothetical protein